MDEVVARDMVAWVEAVEIEPHARKFLGAVGCERLFGLVSLAPPALLDEPRVGALLITRDEVLRSPPLPIQPKSSVGAGDSFSRRHGVQHGKR
jgi:fructose-1-phosphate kinase PfkB-like protein